MRVKLPEGEENDLFYAALMSDMMESFAKCGSLKGLSICSLADYFDLTEMNSAVADACLRFRGCDVSIRLDGIEYNPFCPLW